MTAPAPLPGVETRLAIDSRCTLGEGLVWWEARQVLLWTDIQGSRLWVHEPSSSSTRWWTLPDRLGSLAVCASGRLLLALAKGIHFAAFNDEPGSMLRTELAAPIETGIPTTRVNDGRTDRAGHFVFGTMNEDPAEAAIGSFYQYSAAAGLRRLDLGGVHIPNSICFSLDGRTMYFCDSNRRRIMQCEYDAEAAAVRNVTTFVEFGAGSGTPDGSVVDADGCLWNAEWGAARVCRYTPDGRLDRAIATPARNPTCPAFGGDTLDDLYVTSAREQMTPAELAARPDAGGVYVARRVGVRGVPDRLFDDGR